MAPSPAAGKGTPKTPTKLARKPQQAASQAGEKAQGAAKDVSEKAQDAGEQVKGAASDVTEKAKNAPKETSKVEMKDSSEAGDAPSEVESKVSQSKDDLEEQEPKPISDTSSDAAAGAKKDVEDAADEAEDTADETADETADDATEKAGDIGDETEATETEETPSAADEDEDDEDITDKAKDATGKAGDVAGEAGEGDVEGAAEDAKDTAEDATEEGEEKAGELQEGALDGIKGLKQTEDGLVPDLSVLKGLEVDSEGLVQDSEGNAIGRLAEGDAEDLEGYEIGDEGEILDEDGDLVGRVELLPDHVKSLIEQAKSKGEESSPKLPGLEILEGLTVDAAGQILNDDGDFVGQLVEGDPKELQGKTLNDKGEFLDDEGNVIGRAEVHPDAADLYDTADDAADDAEDAAEDVEEGAEAAAEEGAEEGADKAGDAVDETGDAIDEAAEGELPGIEALEGQEINDEGQIVDAEGNVLGELAEGDLEQVKGMTINDKGEVIDEEGNVIGKVQLADGAQEKLADLAPKTDLRILDGLKVNKKGKILDSEGEPIGELVDGDAAECAGKKVNEKGEVLSKNGEVIGRVKVVPGEAADQALKELLESLGESPEDAPEPGTFLPGLDILDGLKVNKKGKILDEEGEEIGELVDGEISECAGKKCNEKGEVLDKDGNVIGRVKTLPHDVEGGAEGAEEAGEDTKEDAEAAEGEAEGEGEGEGEDATQLPPLSVLEGLKVNKSGKLIDADGNIVGELTEGDAKKLYKSGTACDAEGQFWDNKGHVIGRAKTLPREDAEEEPPFAGLEGLIVTKEGYVQDENGNVVGQVTEGDAKKLAGRTVDEDGDILDKKGSVVGHAERLQDEEAPQEEEPEAPVDLSFLEGKTVNKQGNVIGDEGVPVARLVEGNAKQCAGKKLDAEGQLWNDSGKVIGRVELIPDEERESKPEGIFGGLEGLRVVKDGLVADEDENIVGRIVEGDAKRLIGLRVDEDGDIIDKHGNVKGHAEPIEDEEEAAPADLSILENKVLNKQGFVVNEDGIPLGRLVEGNVKELAGRRCDGEGQIHSDTGKVVGRCELIPENERVARPEGPFAGLEGLRVIKDGLVADADGNTVGRITEGDAKRLVGNKVDEDGDIIDKYGNVKGHAEPYEEEEEAPADLSVLAGCTVNKQGNVVDSNGSIVGRIAEGEIKNLVGKKVDGKGQIWDNAGNVVGRAELTQGADSGPEGPFAGFDEATVQKDGTVQTPAGDIIGRVIEGDVKKLVGHKVDEDGDITDKNGNTIGKAERWEPEEKEKRVNPMSGRRVNKEGEVRDENGDVMGRLTAGDLGHCVGLEVDDNGYVVDNDGNKVGEVTLLENIAEEVPEEDMTEEELQKKQDSELAEKMSAICAQTIERMQPVCKQITEHIEKADRTPKEELDEDELVNNVKPLIEEGSRILNECNGSLRGLDPDGRIAAQAKGRANTREATPEEYRLADQLKELTTTVVSTIDNAKKKLQDMPHAKKKLNPLWALLTEPLFQILAAVGLLLAGVLGLVGQLLSALGLGGLVNGLLGGLGIKKLLGGLGLGGISESLGGGKDKKKGGGLSSLPIVGGLMGGGK